MARKTVNVQEVKDMINEAMLGGEVGPEAQAMRKGMSRIVERILMDTGNYKGFKEIARDDPSRVQYF